MRRRTRSTQTEPVPRWARPLPRRLMSVGQSCETLGIGRTHFYKLVAEKKLGVVKLGSRTLVTSEALDAFIASLSSPSSGNEVDQ